jgi:23S rRNA pseudouridine1911/1915/1917 synthase
MTLNQGYRYRHVLGPNAIGQTTLSYLVRYFAHSTELEWKDRLASGEVELGLQVANGAEQLKAGMVLIWNRPSWLEQETPKNYSLVHLDADLLAVNKPSGLPTIPGAGFYLNTLLSLVKATYPDARPLHRLGRATSGLVLFAMNSHTAAKLTQNWDKLQKQYQALSCSVASEESYDIRSPIGKLEHPRLGTVYAASQTGKPSRSVARVLERRSESTLFEVDLHSGRPHQIRIHLAYIGHPLLGDPLYASGGQPLPDQPGLPGDSGYWLHAKRLVFDHPTTNETIELIAPLPEVLRSNSNDRDERRST